MKSNLAKSSEFSHTDLTVLCFIITMRVRFDIFFCLTFEGVPFDLLDLLSGDDPSSGNSSLEEHRSDFRDAFRVFLESDRRQRHGWKQKKTILNFIFCNLLYKMENKWNYQSTSVVILNCYKILNIPRIILNKVDFKKKLN